jgi:hypothetical protein
MMGEMGKERDDEQDEVYVIAEEGTHDERECASGKREQEHVHRRRFVLGGKGSRDGCELQDT